MKTLMIGSLFALLSISTASADTYDMNDCSSKYNRPIQVPTSSGAILSLSPTTRNGWCAPGLDSEFFGGSDFSEPSGGRDTGHSCGYSGSHRS